MVEPRTTEQRRIFRREMTPELALRIGKLIGNKFRTTRVCTDGSPSAPMIYKAFKAGVICTGGNIVNCGDVPAAAMAYSAEEQECYVTIGSHAPESICGIEIHDSKGGYFNEAQLFSITSMAERLRFPTYDRLGRETFDGSARGRYIDRMTEGISDMNDCIVTLDGSYPVCADTAAEALHRLKVETYTITKSAQDESVTELNENDLDHLTRIKYMDKACLMGAAFDRTGGRLAVFDDEGRLLDPGTVAMILVQMLKPKSICVPVDMTMGIEDVAEGIVIRSQNDIMSVVDMSRDMDFACDGKGHYLFPQQSCAPDAINALIKLTQIAYREKLSYIVDGFNTYYRSNQEMRTSANRQKLDKYIREKISALDYTSFTDIDGYRVAFDTGWFLLRLAKNDPSMSIICEARDKAYLVGLMEIAKNIAAESIKMADQ